MIKFIMTELSFFRKTFKHERTYQWFSIIVLGFIVSQDKMGGISPLIRGLGFGDTAYFSILNFFSQSIYFLPSLESSIYLWITTKFENNLVKIADYKIFVIDGKKIPKDGSHMPGNKWQHQDSNSSSKPTYFTGQFFETIGILVNCSFGCMCLPFAVKMIDGFKYHNRDNSTLKTRSSSFLSSMPIGNSIVVADAWYAARPFIAAIIESGSILVSRVGKSAVGYFSLIEPSQRQRGRPKKYGKKIKLLDLFLTESLTSTVLFGMDKSERVIEYWTKDLMWKPAKGIVRFVGCQMNGKSIILISTSLELSAENIIQSYLYRTSIETSFWYSTQMLFNWCYRFWTKLQIVPNAKFRNCNLHMASKKERKKFWQKIASYECFLLIGFLVQALLLYIIEQKKELFQSSLKVKWFRSTRNSSISLFAARNLVISSYYEYTRSSICTAKEEIFLRFQIDKAQIDIQKQSQKAA